MNLEEAKVVIASLPAEVKKLEALCQEFLLACDEVAERHKREEKSFLERAKRLRGEVWGLEEKIGPLRDEVADLEIRLRPLRVEVKALRKIFLKD